RARVGDNDGARHAAGGVGQLVVRSGGGGRHAGGVRREAACVVVEALHSPEVKDKYLSQGAIAVGTLARVKSETALLGQGDHRRGHPPKIEQGIGRSAASGRRQHGRAWAGKQDLKALPPDGPWSAAGIARIAHHDTAHPHLYLEGQGETLQDDAQGRLSAGQSRHRIIGEAICGTWPCARPSVATWGSFGQKKRSRDDWPRPWKMNGPCVGRLGEPTPGGLAVFFPPPTACTRPLPVMLCAIRDTGPVRRRGRRKVARAKRTEPGRKCRGAGQKVSLAERGCHLTH